MMTRTGIWDSTGPIIIGIITMIVISIIGKVLWAFIPKGLPREIFKVIIIVAIVLGTWASIDISSGIWGNS
ncbi:hypothetical protein [Paenibacillus polymyxa]|uniref:hypothetical protein n=1 Tax=Paenibacillus polymyxa TaxID=1406 RepID=UPI002ED0455E|nr:hypothetical protein [Paenibacillus polymyxa]